MRNRIEEIKSKGFNIIQESSGVQTSYQNYISPQSIADYSKIRVGASVLDDAVFDLSMYKKVNPSCADKESVLRAIDTGDLKAQREISEFFYKTSGIYNRALRYMANIYKYDWYITPYVNDSNMDKKKVLKAFTEGLNILDSFHVKKKLGEIALKVLLSGAYYGYKVQTKQGVCLQELDVNYCRSRFYYGNKPAVEFNMKYFDEKFRDTTQRLKILKMFPSDFARGYNLYKQGKLPPEFIGDENGWYLLDPENTVKFSTSGDDSPMFISAVPLILDLEEAQALDRKKSLQKLLKIVIQKMPLDNKGELIFDVDEARELHKNALKMLSKAIGVDVLTTFADVEVANMSDSNAASAQTDDLLRVERQVYNEFGISQKQFNTDGNLALEKSILNDASSMRNLLFQFEEFLNELLDDINIHPKKLRLSAQILQTTEYNYQELSKLYKEQTQLGYSKMLPQIALGQSQSSILANAYFENDILDLVNVFIPPMMSSTMNGDTVAKIKGSTEESKVGRKEKADDQKSEKTILNKESMN